MLGSSLLTFVSSPCSPIADVEALKAWFVRNAGQSSDVSLSDLKEGPRSISRQS